MPRKTSDEFSTLLAAALQRMSQTRVAEALGIDVRTVRRWKAGESDPPPYIVHAMRDLFAPAGQATPGRRADFTFIDLFAGIGGIRSAFEDVAGQCIFTSEWDNYAQKTYLENHRHDSHGLNGDITKVSTADIPDHDVLLAGFPCQPFSIAGVSKKNALGRTHGF